MLRCYALFLLCIGESDVCVQENTKRITHLSDQPYRHDMLVNACIVQRLCAAAKECMSSFDSDNEQRLQRICAALIASAAQRTTNKFASFVELRTLR